MLGLSIEVALNGEAWSSAYYTYSKDDITRIKRLSNITPIYLTSCICILIYSYLHVFIIIIINKRISWDGCLVINLNYLIHSYRYIFKHSNYINY